jgi:hypothetical protein
VSLRLDAEPLVAKKKHVAKVHVNVKTHVMMQLVVALAFAFSEGGEQQKQVAVTELYYIKINYYN